MNHAQENFIELYGVTHETINMLSGFEALLTEWNDKFNLVAASTLPQIWTRHFSDSAQLMAHLPSETRFLADMGAGAGFPGLVLAIMAKQQALPLHVTAIESTNKKADFLQTVVDKLALNVTIRRDRIESIRDLKADVITARALKALPDLFVYANYLTHKDTTCLFLKGKNLADELTKARQHWTFNAEQHPSRTDDSGTILVIRELCYKTRRHP